METEQEGVKANSRSWESMTNSGMLQLCGQDKGTPASCPPPPHPLRDIVMAALPTGMRRGEILGLKWDYVRLESRFIISGTMPKHAEFHVSHCMGARGRHLLLF